MATPLRGEAMAPRERRATRRSRCAGFAQSSSLTISRSGGIAARRIPGQSTTPRCVKFREPRILTKIVDFTDKKVDTLNFLVE